MKHQAAGCTCSRRLFVLTRTVPLILISYSPLNPTYTPKTSPILYSVQWSEEDIRKRGTSVQFTFRRITATQFIPHRRHEHRIISKTPHQHYQSIHGISVSSYTFFDAFLKDLTILIRRVRDTTKLLCGATPFYRPNYISTHWFPTVVLRTLIFFSLTYRYRLDWYPHMHIWSPKHTPW